MSLLDKPISLLPIPAEVALAIAVEAKASTPLVQRSVLASISGMPAEQGRVVQAFTKAFKFESGEYLVGLMTGSVAQESLAESRLLAAATSPRSAVEGLEAVRTQIHFKRLNSDDS